MSCGSCFGDYPDDDCTRKTCQEFCQDVEICKEGSDES